MFLGVQLRICCGGTCLFCDSYDRYGPQILLSNLNADSTQHSDPALFRHVRVCKNILEMSLMLLGVSGFPKCITLWLSHVQALDESSLRAVITDAMENMALFEAHASPKGARSPSAQTASGFKGAETGVCGNLSACGPS